MAYKVFNTLTGQHEDAATIEEARGMRYLIKQAYLANNESLFSVCEVIPGVDESGNPIETWVPVDVNQV